MIPWFICIVLLISYQQVTSFKEKDLKLLRIYYDMKNQPVPMMTNVSEVVPFLRTPSVRFGPLPCTCQDLTCGCCVNMNIQLFNFQREACTNFTYDPYEFSVGMNMLWNEESVYNTSISGKNPPPLCFPAPIPYLPTIEQCVRVFNIFTPGRNIHMCMNLETRIERAPVLILQFDCMRMGADGVALVKPEAEGGLMPPEQGEQTENPQEAANVFDSVDPDKKKKINVTEGENIQTNVTEVNINSNKTSPITEMHGDNNNTSPTSQINNTETKPMTKYEDINITDSNSFKEYPSITDNLNDKKKFKSNFEGKIIT